MPERITIKCPNPECGREQSVDYSPRMEKLRATCQFCKKRYPFTEWIKGTPQVQVAPRQVQVFPPREKGARIIVQSTGESFQLKVGLNVLGRKSPTSKADIQIPNVTGSNKTSREHMVIIVDKRNGKLEFTASLYKEKAKLIFVGNEPVVYGQWKNLLPGDIISLPDETLRLVVDE